MDVFLPTWTIFIGSVKYALIILESQSYTWEARNQTGMVYVHS